MLDAGSPRVFNVNQMTRQILAKDAAATLFFRNKALNTLVLIKDTVPDDGPGETAPTIGTKLYFPFNDKAIYEGGRTIFLQDKHLKSAISGHFGEGALTPEAFQQDMEILGVLDRLPSLDPFLMKDAFMIAKIAINDAYFEVSPEAWQEIEAFILQRFEPLVKAAFPDAMSSDERARRLIEKIWEARDLTVLQPLIDAFRLPQDGALAIFSAWKGINFYAFQYTRTQPQFVEMAKWLNELKPGDAVPIAERKEMLASRDLVKAQLRQEWQVIDTILREYQDAYDKMFKHQTSSAEFLNFLKGSSKSYWKLGSSLGKAGHAVYCWDVMTNRFANRKQPWTKLLDTVSLLARIFPAPKKAASKVAW
jgi:hypothetical protein